MDPRLAHLEIRHEMPYPSGMGAPERVDLWIRPPMGGYAHIIDFDPGQLKIDNKARPPQRLDKSHFQEIHNSRLNRVRKHGSVSFNNSSIMEY